jgi:hypothetical protein
MDEDYEFDEGSDIDNWEDEQVFQDHEGEEYPEEASYSEEDMPTDAFDDWRDDANEFGDDQLGVY